MVFVQYGKSRACDAGGDAEPFGKPRGKNRLARSEISGEQDRFAALKAPGKRFGKPKGLFGAGGDKGLQDSDLLSGARIRRKRRRKLLPEGHFIISRAAFQPFPGRKEGFDKAKPP